MKKFIWFKWKWVPGGFWGLQLRINTQNSKIQYGGSNMTVENVKIYLIGEFSKSLIANLCLTFRNSKWRIQSGELKYKKLLDSDENRYYAVFQVAECGLNDWTSRRSILLQSTVTKIYLSIFYHWVFIKIYRNFWVWIHDPRVCHIESAILNFKIFKLIFKL